MSDTPIYKPGQVVGGRYRIEAPLSRGGMGAVFLAQQVSLGREVALKVLLDRGSDPELLKRFDVEAKAVCQLRHPNIITYHDYGRDEHGHPFLVMEYLAGYPGTKLVGGAQRRPVEDLVHILGQVCSALHEAHAKKIIHRDLKWSNVMICPQSHDPLFVKLIDFGIMKVPHDQALSGEGALTQTGMLLGTPQYMSPEAICGMPVDGRADQYALAIMLWEAIEGERPFDGAPQFELLRRQVQDAPPPMTKGQEVLDRYPRLEAVIERGMEKHPKDRYGSILEFRDALEEALRPHAVETRPVRAGARQSEPGPPVATPADVTAPPSGGFNRRKAFGFVALFIAVATMSGLLVALLMPSEDPVASPEVAATSGEVAATAGTQSARPTAEKARVETPLAAKGLEDTMQQAREDDAASGDGNHSVAEERDATRGELLDVVDKGRNEGVGKPLEEGVGKPLEEGVAEPPKKTSNDAGSVKDGSVRQVSSTSLDKPRTGVSPQTNDSGTKETKLSQSDKQANEGTMSLFAEPWAMVTIDDVRVADAPFYHLPVPAGTRRVVVWNPGAFRGKYAFSVSVKPGEHVMRTVKLADHLTPFE
jgi:hypothetical protein